MITYNRYDYKLKYRCNRSMPRNRETSISLIDLHTMSSGVSSSSITGTVWLEVLLRFHSTPRCLTFLNLTGKCQLLKLELRPTEAQSSSLLTKSSRILSCSFFSKLASCPYRWFGWLERLSFFFFSGEKERNCLFKSYTDLE